MDKTAIEAFLHAQVAAWNAGDKAGFFAAYRDAAPQGLAIEYVGRGPASDGWPVLEGMWAQQSAKIEIEELALDRQWQRGGLPQPQQDSRHGPGDRDDRAVSLRRRPAARCATSSRQRHEADRARRHR